MSNMTNVGKVKELLECLSACEFALTTAINKDKTGWLEQEARDDAREMLKKWAESDPLAATLDTAFSNGKWAINVKTVGQMIDELIRLPLDLEVKSGFQGSADLVVFNRDCPSKDRPKVRPHLEVADGGDWDEDGGGQ